MPISIPKKLAQFASSVARPLQDMNFDGDLSGEHKDLPEAQAEVLLEELTEFQQQIVRILYKIMADSKDRNPEQILRNDFPLALDETDIGNVLKVLMSNISEHETHEVLKDAYSPVKRPVEVHTLEDLIPGDILQLQNYGSSNEEALVFKKDQGTKGEYLLLKPKNEHSEIPQTVLISDQEFLFDISEVSRPTIRSIVGEARGENWGEVELNDMFDVQYPLRALAMNEHTPGFLDCEDLDVLLDGIFGTHGLHLQDQTQKWLVVSLYFLAKNEKIIGNKKRERIAKALEKLNSERPELFKELPQVRKYIGVE